MEYCGNKGRRTSYRKPDRDKLHCHGFNDNCCNEQNTSKNEFVHGTPPKYRSLVFLIVTRNGNGFNEYFAVNRIFLWQENLLETDFSKFSQVRHCFVTAKGEKQIYFYRGICYNKNTEELT